MDGLNSLLAVTALPPLTTYQTPRTNPEPRHRREHHHPKEERSDREESEEEDNTSAPSVEALNPVEDSTRLGSHIDIQI
ncbi:MAG: hypothetical protein FJY65_00325 [Calditrichaeota bacterium]|nr:hypothetical protein [Calditrichota bacterium]